MVQGAYTKIRGFTWAGFLPYSQISDEAKKLDKENHAILTLPQRKKYFTADISSSKSYLSL
jgi:hypothetical protein